MKKAKWKPFRLNGQAQPTEDDLKTAWGALYSYFCAVLLKIGQDLKLAEKTKVVALKKLLEALVYSDKPPSLASGMELIPLEGETEQSYTKRVVDKMGQHSQLRLVWDPQSRRWSDSSGVAPKVTLEIPNGLNFAGTRVYAEIMDGKCYYLVFVGLGQFDFSQHSGGSKQVDKCFAARYVITGEGEDRISASCLLYHFRKKLILKGLHELVSGWPGIEVQERILSSQGDRGYPEGEFTIVGSANGQHVTISVVFGSKLVRHL